MISGPVDFVAVGFPGGGLNEELIANLMELVDSGVVRIIDAVVVIKDEEGEVTALEVEDLDAATAAMLAPLANDLTGMVSFEDIAMIAEELENDSRGDDPVREPLVSQAQRSCLAQRRPVVDARASPR